MEADEPHWSRRAGQEAIMWLALELRRVSALKGSADAYAFALRVTAPLDELEAAEPDAGPDADAARAAPAGETVVESPGSAFVTRFLRHALAPPAV